MVSLSFSPPHSLSLSLSPWEEYIQDYGVTANAKGKVILFTAKLCSVKVLEEMDQFSTGSSCELSHSHPHAHY